MNELDQELQYLNCNNRRNSQGTTRRSLSPQMNNPNNNKNTSISREASSTTLQSIPPLEQHSHPIASLLLTIKKDDQPQTNHTNTSNNTIPDKNSVPTTSTTTRSTIKKEKMTTRSRTSNRSSIGTSRVAMKRTNRKKTNGNGKQILQEYPSLIKAYEEYANGK